MNRRTWLCSAIALFAAGRTQAQNRTYRLAWLGSGSGDPGYIPYYGIFFDRLRQRGYAEGKNLVVERRYAEGAFDRLPALAAELVTSKPDIIIAAASQATLAASKATKSIPIVFVAVSDPIGIGVVKSLARPGTNATGFSLQNIEVHNKRLQLLREAWPQVKTLAVLHNPLNAVEHMMLGAVRDTAGRLKLDIHVVEMRQKGDIERAFRDIDQRRPDALYVLESPFSILHRERIVSFANDRRLPAMYGLDVFAVAGGLVSYAFDVAEHYRLAADYVARILEGAKPAELPVQQPAQFSLILNLKTARALNIAFPPGFVARADRIIE